MKTKLLVCIAAALIGTEIIIATPAIAFHGGGFGGGMHGGGFGGGGMHFGGGGFRGGMVTGRSVFVPGGTRLAGVPFTGRRFAGGAHNAFFFRHHPHFRNFVFIGGPFLYDDVGYYGDSCWQQVWAPYGWQWTNVCFGYGF